MFTKGHIFTDDEEAQVDKAEERLEKYLGREGQVKTEIIVSVSGSLVLMLQRKRLQKRGMLWLLKWSKNQRWWSHFFKDSFTT